MRLSETDETTRSGVSHGVGFVSRVSHGAMRQQFPCVFIRLDGVLHGCLIKTPVHEVWSQNHARIALVQISHPRFAWTPDTRPRDFSDFFSASFQGLEKKW